MRYFLPTVLLILFTTQVSAQKPLEIKYFQGSLSEFQVTAKEKRVPALIYLHGEEDAQEILYDRRTLSDTTLIKMLDTALMVYQVDMSINYNEALKFSIEDIPVFILLDKNGWEINRMYGYRSKDEIIKFVKEIYE